MTPTISITTFGNTPASLYLVRVLNERNPSAVRLCSVRTRSFNTNVNEIEYCVEHGTMTAHTAANLLRLLRLEATTIAFDDSVVEGKFIAQLLRNVIIGNIKRAIRRVEILRKVENGNSTITKVGQKANGHVLSPNGQLPIHFHILGYPAGMLDADGDYHRVVPTYSSITDNTTPELLMERSNRRCLRQKKPHMMEVTQ